MTVRLTIHSMVYVCIQIINLTLCLQRLGVEIPEFVLHRRVQVHMEEREGEEGARVTVTGLDVKENVPYSFIKVGPRYMYIEREYVLY